MRSVLTDTQGTSMTGWTEHRRAPQGTDNANDVESSNQPHLYAHAQTGHYLLTSDMRSVGDGDPEDRQHQADWHCTCC